MPDKASLHLIAIEDRDYKEERIDCKFYLAKQRDFVFALTRYRW